MGLDISYYKNIQRINCLEKDGEPLDAITGTPLENYIHVYINPDFPDRCRDVEGGYYRGEEGEGFRAGSYGGYNRWRDQLAKLAGYPLTPNDEGGSSHDSGAWAATGGPFWELINFSDCEGAIGTEVSRKLAQDFADFQERAEAVDSSEYDFIGRYNEWRKAFETAAQGGVVCFH